MTVHLTPAQARRLGINVESGSGTSPVPVATRRTTRIVAKGAPYRTVCVLCHTSFTTQAVEDRHLTATSPAVRPRLEVLP